MAEPPDDWQSMDDDDQRGQSQEGVGSQEGAGSQSAVTERLRDGLAAGRDVLLERPGGTEATLAALPPALRYAKATDRTVVVATPARDRARRLGRAVDVFIEPMDGVDLVVREYRHILAPSEREQFFRSLGRDPADVVAVFEQAHRLERAARRHGGLELAESTFDDALAALDERERAGERGDGSDSRVRSARNVIEPFRVALVETYTNWAESGGGRTVGDGWADVPVDEGRGRDDLTMAFLDSYSGPGFERDLERALGLGSDSADRADGPPDGETGYATPERECSPVRAARFVETWLARTANRWHYPVVGVRLEDGGLHGRAEVFPCLPRAVTGASFEKLHASVLTGATLRPFDALADVLGLEDPISVVDGRSRPEHRRRTYAVGVPALFASRRDDPTVERTVVDTLTRVARFTPGNVLAFFTSYAQAARYHDLVDLESRSLLDRPGVSSDDRRAAFVEADEAVLFTSFWGPLGDGGRYEGDDARTVVIVGVPFPAPDHRAEAVRTAYDEAFRTASDGVSTGPAEAAAKSEVEVAAKSEVEAAAKSEVGAAAEAEVGAAAEADAVGWRYGVEVPTTRRIRQALDRVLGSPSDFGARVLVDERYTAGSRTTIPEFSVHDAFPPEMRADLIDVEPAKLQYALLNFYADMDAWDGDPPVPEPTRADR